MRLRPAESRIRKLAAETPSSLIVFDLLLAPDSRSLMQETLRHRRAALESLMADVAGSSRLVLSPMTRETEGAERWLAQSAQGSARRHCRQAIG